MIPQECQFDLRSPGISMDHASPDPSAENHPEPVLEWRWIHTGDEAFDNMCTAIQQAQRTVDFETYIYTDTEPGQRVREALEQAARRGVRVRVQIDAFGSLGLGEAYWESLREAGGLVRWFNPFTLRHFNVRNHRKLLVCDDAVAFLGGFNVGEQWVGDGLTRGWRDLGLILKGDVARTLAGSFDQTFSLADFRHRRPQRLRPRRAVISDASHQALVLAAGPGRGRHPIRVSLMQDLRTAREVRIIASYFLPPGRLLHALKGVARRGGFVHLILPARTDITLMQCATRGLYGGLLRAGVRIHEYAPQILHSKFIQIDQAVYVGSANLDRRSFGTNYELLVRIDSAKIAAEGRAIFDQYLQHSTAIERLSWSRSRNLWERAREWIAGSLFARLDPFITRSQLRDFR
jgi:cardiolipin synthase A/B